MDEVLRADPSVVQRVSQGQPLMVPMPDTMHAQLRGHNRGSYSTSPCTWTAARTSLSRSLVPVAQVRLVSMEGGNGLYKPELPDCPLRQVDLHDIKTSDTPDIGGAWVLI